jgi:ABC-type nitrate/sulfonate/bicarbonate transport system permease component
MARRVLHAARVVVPPLLLVGALVAYWQWYVVSHDVPARELPSPGRVIVKGWGDRAALWEHTRATLQVTFVGFGVSLLVTSQTLPIIALAPLMITWFGFGLQPKVVVVALVTFFPITVGLIEGFASTERAATNLLRSMGAGRWQQFRYVRLPAAMPFFFAALRISITYAVVGAIFAEYVGSQKGLGIYMNVKKNLFRTDLVLAAVVVSAVLSVGLFLLTSIVQRCTIPWYAKARRHGPR